MFSITLISIGFEDAVKEVCNVDGKAFACRRLKEIVRSPLQLNRRLFWCLLSLENENEASSLIDEEADRAKTQKSRTAARYT